MDALLRDDTPKQLREKLNGWFLSGASGEEKAHLLAEKISDEEFFERPVSKAEFTDHSQRRLFDKIVDRLGWDADEAGHEAAKPVSLKIKRRVSFIMRIAVVVVPVIIVAGILLLSDLKKGGNPVKSGSEYNMTVATTFGNTRQVSLPDGSTVILNGFSTLSCVDDFENDRRVHLDGEAFFSVVKSDGKPFNVEANGIDVAVLGTEFTVKANSEEEQIEVALFNGRVEVSTQHQKVVLDPMEMATCDKNLETIVKSVFDPEAAPKWIGGEIDIDGIGLREALIMVGDNFGMDVVFEQEPPADKIIEASFDRNTNPETILDMLRYSTASAFNYEIIDNTIVIKK